jgi:hypothetical protein
MGLFIPYCGDSLVECFKGWLHRTSGLDKFKEEEEREIQVPPWLTGVFERYMTVALVVVGLDSASLGAVVLAWMGAKLAANWQRRVATDSTLDDEKVRARTIVALMTGVLSLGIGIIAGALTRYSLCGSDLVSSAHYCQWLFFPKP